MSIGPLSLIVLLMTLVQTLASHAAIPSISTVRVKIFPHLGAYSAPQKSETETSSVKLFSQAKCKRITQSLVAESPPSIELLPPRSRLTLKASELQDKKVTLECDSPVNINRGEGLDIFFYDGKIEAKLIKGQLTLINEVTLEDYVKGVLPAEMPCTWHDEALKAQAIAARTYAVHQILQIRNKKAERSFDVDDTVQYQAFLGKSWQTIKTNRAVDATQSVILTYENAPIRAYFSADSGCHTESAKNIWGERYDVPYTPSKAEFYDSKTKTDWSFDLSLEKIQTKTAKYLNLPNGVCIKDVQIAEKAPSGRATKIKLVPCSSDNKVRTLSAEIFRQYMNLPSTLFEIRPLSTPAETLQFKGQGSGHGVGMNQTGANALAKELGWGYYQILNYYYDGIQFESAR